MQQEEVVKQVLDSRDKLFAYAWAILRDEQLSEDIFQEVTMLALQKHAEINDSHHLFGWMRETARRKSLEMVRTRSRSPVLLDPELLELLEPEWRNYDTTTAVELQTTLQKCLARLSPNARRIIEMRYGNGLKSSEIATRLTKRVETVYISLSRIHSFLAGCARNQLPNLRSSHE